VARFVSQPPQRADGAAERLGVHRRHPLPERVHPVRDSARHRRRTGCALHLAEATTTGAGVLAGHLLTDQPVVGSNNFAAPLIDHGRVKAAKVPTGTDAFTAPVAAAKRAVNTIVYI
jgi:hypothetical protein